MSTALRVILIICALLTFAYILRRVKKCDMGVADTVFWIVLSAVLAIIALFPQIVFAMSDILGFAAPINFIFILMIAILVFKVFSMSIELSQLKRRLAALVQSIGIDGESK